MYQRFPKQRKCMHIVVIGKNNERGRIVRIKRTHASAVALVRSYIKQHPNKKAWTEEINKRQWGTDRNCIWIESWPLRH